MKRLVQLPVLVDNYVYVVASDRDVIVVDPAEADPVLAWLNHAGRTLTAVLNTHHHGDHTGGNEELRARTGCAVIGPERDRARIPAMTRGVEVGAVVDVGDFSFRVLDVKAHTRGHVAYVDDRGVDVVVKHGHGGASVEDVGGPVAFVGDSLFGAGCGRLFEGDGDDLFAALSALDALDDDVLVACAHEYTASNLAFAVAVAGHKDAVRQRAADLDRVKGASRSSVPSRLGLERRTNPFLLALRHDDVGVGVTARDRALSLRVQKDSFRA